MLTGDLEALTSFLGGSCGGILGVAVLGIGSGGLATTDGAIGNSGLTA